MAKLEPVSVIGEANRKDNEGAILMNRTWAAPGSVLAEILAMEPGDLTREHAVTCSTNMASQVPMWAVGCTAGITAAGISEEEWFTTAMSDPGFLAPPDPRDRNVHLALLCLDLLRDTQPDSQPEGVTVGAAACVCWLTMFKPELGKALWEAGGLEVTNAILQRYNPMERISRCNLIPSACLGALKDLSVEALAAGVDVIGPLIEAGAMDMVIQNISAYQMLGKPNEASVTAMEWGTLYFLEVLLESPESTGPLIAKLRGAGAEMFRYLLDHPLENFPQLGYETGQRATKIAALVWGKDDDVALAFKQVDVDKILLVANLHDPIICFRHGNGICEDHARAILSLTVSDVNKDLLLNADGLLAVLVDSLLLDPEHPIRSDGRTNFEAICGPVQRDFAEALAQLAVYPPGRQVLLQDPTVVEALKQVAAKGWLDEAKRSAESALAALSDVAHEASHHKGHRHVMISYQWDCQQVVKRIVGELKARSYHTWFDLDNLKGSTLDGMSDAVDNAAVLLICISLACE
jgi:hypothetical protein